MTRINVLSYSFSVLSRATRRSAGAGTGRRPFVAWRVVRRFSVGRPFRRPWQRPAVGPGQLHWFPSVQNLPLSGFTALPFTRRRRVRHRADCFERFRYAGSLWSSCFSGFQYGKQSGILEQLEPLEPPSRIIALYPRVSAYRDPWFQWFHSFQNSFRIPGQNIDPRPDNSSRTSPSKSPFC
jgi:hypothetical protein